MLRSICRLSLAVLVTLVSLSMVTPVSAQGNVDVHWFSLAGPDGETRSVASGMHQVCVKDMIPGAVYDFNQRLIAVEIPTPKPGSDQARVLPAEDHCAPFQAARQLPPATEAEIPDWLERLGELSRQCPGSEELLKESIESTRRCFSPARVTRRQGIEASVQRATRKGGWTFQLLPPVEKVWFTSYGVQAIPDEDERYFTMALDADQATDDEKFEILRHRRDSQDYDADALVLFTRLWLPEWSWRPGWSAGAGLDSNKLAFFTGPSMAISDFLFISGGLAFHPQKRLAGSYGPNQKVAMELTESVLVEETHDFNWFLGVTLAFDKSPFPKKEPNKTATPGPAEGGADGKSSGDKKKETGKDKG